MGKYLSKIILFLIVLIAVLQLHKKLNFTEVWGNKELSQKINLLEAKSDKYNLVFIGYSKTYRSIIPKLFNNLVKNGVSCFNLGVPGMYFFETAALTEKVIKNSKLNSIDKIILQHQLPKEIAKKNLYSDKVTYFMDLKTTVRSVKYYASKKLHFKQVAYHLTAFFRNILMMRSLHKMKYFENKFESIELWRMQKAGDGYVSLEDELETFKRDAIVKRRKRLEKVSPKVKVFNDIDKPLFDSENQQQIINIYNSLYDLAKSKNIELQIMIDPDHLNFLDEKFKGNVIDLPKKKDFKSYYEVKNRFDRGHLNSKGAKIYTKKVARSFIDLAKDN